MEADFKKPTMFFKELEANSSHAPPMMGKCPGWRTDSKVNFYHKVR